MHKFPSSFKLQNREIIKKVPHDSYHDFRGKKVQNQGKVPHDSDTKISLKNLQNREKVPHPQ